jgi:triacylglycerol esterase/lipase EstA (alpha/beta hydrolase family)
MVGTALMLQSLIRMLLLVEVLLYVWLAAYLAKRGVGPGQIGALILLFALLWRLSHALASYLVAAALRARDGRPMQWEESLAALTSELKARAMSYNWSQAFPRQVMGQDPVGGGGGMPILLVHGFFSNRGMWVRFRQRLAAAKIGPVYTVTLEPMTGSIDAMAKALDERIEEILRAAGQEKIIVVAHSMGALVTRAYMAQSGAKRVSRFITLGAPHHGTRLAGMGIFECARQMKYRGPWLEMLADMEAADPSGVPTLSIYTLNEDLVYPPESSVLEWAECVPVSAVGHVGLLFSEPVANRVIAAIRKHTFAA